MQLQCKSSPHFKHSIVPYLLPVRNMEAVLFWSCRLFFFKHVPIKERRMQSCNSFFCPVAKTLFRYPCWSNQMIRICFQDSKGLMKSGGALSTVTNQRMCLLPSITIVCSWVWTGVEKKNRWAIFYESEVVKRFEEHGSEPILEMYDGCNDSERGKQKRLWKITLASPIS